VYADHFAAIAFLSVYLFVCLSHYGNALKQLHWSSKNLKSMASPITKIGQRPQMKKVTCCWPRPLEGVVCHC